MRNRSALGIMVIALVAITLVGCGAALAAGAGAGAAVAYSERGVSSQVTNSVDEVLVASRGVFGELEITQTGEEVDDQGAERELKGTRGDLEITVDIERESASLTSVEVYARQSAIEWDREYARDVLARILDRL